MTVAVTTSDENRQIKQPFSNEKVVTFQRTRDEMGRMGGFLLLAEKQGREGFPLAWKPLSVR